ncbi:MAG: hypothetical protein V1489_01720 [Candidatus Liptonbacteria bacterium]
MLVLSPEPEIDVAEAIAEDPCVKAIGRPEDVTPLREVLVGKLLNVLSGYSS